MTTIKQTISGNHKIGIHVTGSHRDNYGIAAPRAVAITAIDDPSAFDEAPPEAILVYRTQLFHDHKDAPGDFDKLPDEQLFAAGEYWWSRMRGAVLPVLETYGKHRTYFQPTNEVNNPRITMYLRGYMQAAEKDGAKLALFGDGGGSPDWPDWVDYWVPLLDEAQRGGHIYSRHVYSGLPNESGNIYDLLTDSTGRPIDSNANRPLREAAMLRELGITTPILITEGGWLRGWEPLPFDWQSDLVAYSRLIMEHDNIISFCVWNAGNWETAPNILSGRPLADMAAIMAAHDGPAFFDPSAVVVVEPPTEPEPVIIVPMPPGDPVEKLPLSLPYIATAILLPQDVPFLDLVSKQEWADVAQEIHQYRRSVYWSHDDAVAATYAGMPGSKVVIYGDRPDAVALAESWDVAVEVRPLPEKITPPAIPDANVFRFENWPTQYKIVTQKYGANPEYYSRFGLTGHEGIDIRAPHGSAIYAVADGTVSRVNDSRKSKAEGGHNYGVHVRVRHVDGYETIYAHFDKRLVNAGDKVKAGQIIGLADNTGNSRGSHLHLTLKKDGKIIDPTTYLHNRLPVPSSAIAIPEPVEPPKKYHNVWEAMTNGLQPFGRPYEVRHSDGSQSSFQLQYDSETGRHYMVKGERTNAEYEEFWLENGYIMRGRDTSPGAGRYYEMSENGKYGARWLPEKMYIGQTFTRTATVTYYTKDGRLLQRSEVTDTMKFENIYESLRSSTGIVVKNVFEFSWSGGESYLYGEDDRGETLGLVSWGRTHQDANTPRRSEISELHEYGARPNSIRETVTVR